MDVLSKYGTEDKNTLFVVLTRVQLSQSPNNDPFFYKQIWVKPHAHQLKGKMLIVQIINENAKLIINKLTIIRVKYDYLIFKNLCYLSTP